MTKAKYPIEAFALAMVLFSTDIKTAAMVAVCMVVADVVASMLQGKSKQTAGIAGGAIAAVLSAVAAKVAGTELGVFTLIGCAAIGVAMAKHFFEQEEAGLNIKEDIVAAAAFVVVGAIRQVLASDTAGVLSSNAYGKPMFGLICGGLAIALVNKVCKTTSTKDAALFVCLPAIVACAPFTWAKLETVGAIVAMVMVAVMYYTFRNKLVFSTTEETSKGVPVEMVLLGMIYMIVTIL